MHNSAEQAEIAFYTAFQKGDQESMSRIWARSDHVVCIHPHGPQLQGYEQVMESWRKILRDTGGFRITIEVLHHYTDEQVSVRFVNETVSNEHAGSEAVTLLVTNAYQKTESGWRMVLHHASPQPTISGTADDPDEAPDTDVTLH